MRSAWAVAPAAQPKPVCVQFERLFDRSAALAGRWQPCSSVSYFPQKTTRLRAPGGVWRGSWRRSGWERVPRVQADLTPGADA